ncbi:hypothetical protein U3516DRAFT_765600 [Neocallimastix sp. 'constans']
MKITDLFYFYIQLAIINFSQALRCGEKFNNRKCPDKQCYKEYGNASYGCQSRNLEDVLEKVLLPLQRLHLLLIFKNNYP